MLLYLADKFKALVPADPRQRAECLNSVFWQVGSAPFVGGGFGHFYTAAPVSMKYPIADIMIWPWYGQLVLNNLYDAAEFLDAAMYLHVVRWARQMAERDAVVRGRMVNRAWGPLEGQLHERHDAGDFDTMTQDKLG